MPADHSCVLIASFSFRLLSGVTGSFVLFLRLHWVGGVGVGLAMIRAFPLCTRFAVALWTMKEESFQVIDPSYTGAGRGS